MRRLALTLGVVALLIGATSGTAEGWVNAPPKHPGMYCAKRGHPFVGREGKLVFWCKTWAPGKKPKPRRHCLHYSHVPKGQHRRCLVWS